MSETIVRPDVAVRDGFGPFATRLRERPCRIAYAGNSVIAQQWRVCPPLPASDAPVGSLHADHYEFARPLRPSQAMLTNPSGCRPGRFRLVHLDLAIDAGNEAVFNTGPDSVVGLLLITDPDCGRLELRIGTGSVEYQTFDRWCDRDLIRTPVFSESAPPGVTMQLRGQGQRIAGAMDADDDPTFLKLADLLLHDASRHSGRSDQRRDEGAD